MKKTNDLTKAVVSIMRFRKGNIDVNYNKQFQRWLYQTSHEQDEIPIDKDGIRRTKFDENGLITNATFSGKTRSGFDLLEEDFIKLELKRINSIDLLSLDIDNQKYIAFLKEYFENKKSVKKSPETKPKKDNAQYHVISFILDCYANKKQLPTGKQWEKAGEKRKKYTKKGNTFYKEANKILDKNFTKHKLSNLLGDDWQSIVLERSNDPKALKAYLDTLA